jgi:hypothetical protein
MRTIAKCFPFLAAAGLGYGLCCAQPLRITGLERTGTLTWTNLICTTQPVYELLKASALDGSWEHVAFVTNDTQFVLSDLSNPATGARFFRVAWVNEPPLVFDYAFIDPEFGLTTVTGQLTVSLTGSAIGKRSFHPTEFYDFGNSIHPLGEAPLPLGRPPYSKDGVTLRVFLQGMGGESSIYLDGTLERSEVGGRCVYTGYAGIVWFVGFDTEGIGTFVATRAPANQ